MSRTIINVGAVIDATNQINSAKSSVSSAKSSFTQTKNSIDRKIQNRSNIRNRLSAVSSQLSSIDSQIGSIRSMVQSGANLYRTTDERVESWRDDIRNNVGPFAGVKTSSNWSAYFNDSENGGKLKECYDALNKGLKKLHSKMEAFGKAVKLKSSTTAGPDANAAEGLQSRGLKPDTADMGRYIQKAPPAEYAKLCELWYKALEQKDKDFETAFIESLKEKLPDNDPLKYATPAQLTSVNVAGLDAMVISDGSTAVVIFAGTDVESFDDIVSDVAIVAGTPSLQEGLAIALVDAVSKGHSKIVLTGHSLGGYLATAATLKTDAVMKCVAFDPPGRYDDIMQSIFNHDRVGKITTYEANGSPISDGLKWVSLGNNQNVGNVINIDVEKNSLNHGIKQIGHALGGEEAINNSWR